MAVSATAMLIGLCALATAISAHPAKSIHVDAQPTARHQEHQHPDDWELPAMASRRALPGENDNAYWLKKAADFVAAQRALPRNQKRAKNVIMFLGDGMSATTIAATRPYVQGEETDLHFERFPVVGTAKTYCVNYQVADSASTATAYLGGVKGNYGTVGVTGAVDRYNCSQQVDPATHVKSIAAWAQAAGKWTGFVTTSPVTDASPAGLFAHSANRYWENDVELRRDCNDTRVEDITRQLVHGEVGSKMRVIMGGGRNQFRSVEVADEERGQGLREDGRNLIGDWAALKGERGEYVWNATHLRQLGTSNVDYLLGLFEPGSLKFNLEVQAERNEHLEPTLTEMTLKAIEVLRRSEEGFFLFVENGKIDTAHHSSFARLALDETAQLAEAVKAAREALSEDDTLIVVTADHSHTLSYAGYPTRGADITGKLFNAADDNLPYMTLGYANGPGFANQWQAGVGRLNLTEVDATPLRFRYPATIPTSSETHAGEDVLVYASGPWSHLFTGNYEQSAIPRMMAHAACLNGACDSGN